MQVYFDLALGLFLQSPNSNNEITQITAKRATSNTISLQFLNNGTPTTLPVGTSFIFAAKATAGNGSGFYDGPFAVYEDVWSGPDLDGFYSVQPGYNTTVLNTLFGYTYPNQDTFPHPDSVLLDGEISWLKPGDTLYTKTPYWTLLCYNDVSKGIEGVPTSGGPVYPAPSAIELLANKGQPNGYCPLGSSSLVPIVNLPIATGTSKGIIQVGAGLAITGGGILSATGTASVAIATGSSLGVIKVGSGLAIDGGGTLTATGSAPTPWIVKTANYAAVAGDRIQADTSAGIFTITLPASATVGDSIPIEDSALTWGTNNLTIARNGLKINGGTANYVGSASGSKLSLVYISVGYGWSIK